MDTGLRRVAVSRLDAWRHGLRLLRGGSITNLGRSEVQRLDSLRAQGLARPASAELLYDSLTNSAIIAGLLQQCIPRALFVREQIVFQRRPPFANAASLHFLRLTERFWESVGLASRSPPFRVSQARVLRRECESQPDLKIAQLRRHSTLCGILLLFSIGKATWSGNEK
jgi:hypothetical protein